MKNVVDYSIQTNPINVDGIPIKFVSTAEHVGVVRSTTGNLPTIFARITAHKKALGAVIHTGMARSHRGNPRVSLRIERLYGIPVLLSGLSSLIISSKEEHLIEQHLKDILSGLQRFHPKTPRAVIYFMGGILPGPALLHMRQLGLFGMVCRSPDSILHKLAFNLFHSKIISSNSWFHQIREYCLQYGLPHPLKLLSSPLSKYRIKIPVKKHMFAFKGHHGNHPDTHDLRKIQE